MNRTTTLVIAAALASALITLPAWAIEQERPLGLPKPTIKQITPVQTTHQQQGQGQGQGQGQQQAVSVRTGNPTLRAEQSLNLSVNHAAQERNPVNSAIAPGLAVSNGTCFGTSGAGLTVTGFSVSAGGPTLDVGCDIRYDEAMLRARGEHLAAFERSCDKPEIRAARKRANTPCLADTPHAGAVITETCLDPAGQPYTDPLVAARACPVK